MNTLKAYFNDNGLYPSQGQLNVLANRAFAYIHKNEIRYELVEGQRLFDEETLAHVLNLVLDGEVMCIQAVNQMTKSGDNNEQ